MRAGSDPAVPAVITPVQKAAAGASHLGIGTLAPAADGAHGALKPTHKRSVVVPACRLIFGAVTVDAWRDLQLDVRHGQADKLETNETVSMIDGVAGIAGVVPLAVTAGNCSSDTPESLTRHIISK